jgi:hypothetical protein
MIFPLIAMLSVLAVVEFVLSTTFAHKYFTVGLRLLKVEAGCLRSSNQRPSPEQIAAAIPRSILIGFVFEEIEASCLAFREGGWSLRIAYLPIIHGTLRFDRDARRVEVIGLANWLPLGWLVVTILLVPLYGPTLFLFFAGAFLFIYVVQTLRFREVAQVAAVCWQGVSPRAA